MATRRSQTVVSWDVDEKGKQQCLFRCPSRKAKPASTACLFKTLDAFRKNNNFSILRGKVAHPWTWWLRAAQYWV
jgi:hypothetical protein